MPRTRYDRRHTKLFTHTHTHTTRVLCYNSVAKWPDETKTTDTARYVVFSEFFERLKIDFRVRISENLGNEFRSFDRSLLNRSGRPRGSYRFTTRGAFIKLQTQLTSGGRDLQCKRCTRFPFAAKENRYRSNAAGWTISIQPRILSVSRRQSGRSAVYTSRGHGYYITLLLLIRGRRRRKRWTGSGSLGPAETESKTSMYL